MKYYEEPSVELVKLDLSDIIVTSGCGGAGCPNEGEEDHL